MEEIKSWKQNYFEVLGVRINVTQIPDVINKIKDWIGEGSKGNFIAVTGFHGIMESKKDVSFKLVLNSASLVVPDGISLIWLGRRAGHILKKRVYGPELMDSFLKETGIKYRHFLYGGAFGAADNLSGLFSKLYPEVNFAGVYSPPSLGPDSEETDDVINMINQSKPDIIWVGLSTPKQERWMFKHRNKLDVPVMIGVGAAFDFLSGLKPQAPSWMRESGLEWLFRLASEPKRLWRRYLIDGPKFLFYIILERLFSK